MKIYLWLIGLLWVGVLSAQKQEMEQLQLNMEKLVQLRLMLQQAKQGYQLLQNGYTAVRDAARGNYDLHKSYLDGLLQVSEQVRNAPAVKRITANWVKAQKEYRDWLTKMQGMGAGRFMELSLWNQRYQQVAYEMGVVLDQLGVLLAPGGLRMSEGERIASIERLAVVSDQPLLGLRQFIKEQTVLVAGKVQQEKDRQAMLRLYGLH
ncbi:MAG: hypothetical protein IM584_02310 [Chitinophagaceae bacterium]|nr:hypothetical protein [Chitinophagaceae bacterium]MCA6451812.1 hypothetical protein [Chitinophagaceae bacterium]MCA6454947.1 hypothetical protein [Chitinophagaceae bacterium]MCA6460417.1 hypothetical protein [Chitinophagaceae bacterium]MCA6465304.1 hypothetical protein [Chitinophagaceae bacterium]